MGMSFINWIGFVMLVLALLLNELFLGMNAWYDLNLGAIVVGIVYLVVGVSLSLWPSPQDQTA
jgi:NhaP-type Na+/H+ or K+/H+ antiporter